jgi:hypothetical protein
MLRLGDDSRAILAECERDARDIWDAADDADDAELTLPCPACGRPVTAPADAEGDSLCCNAECVRVVCARMDAELRELRAGPWPVEVAWGDDEIPY